jgi:17beta-estradiol 17-dehydrogenase / very-long-chain 3-oxoacyl-CoA reductase
MFINQLLQYFGLTVFTYTTIKYLLKFYNNISTFYFNTGCVDFKKYGSWAVVTGSTDGIGEAYTQQLAERGLNIVLISRSLDKLKKQSKELIEKYSIKTIIIEADFTSIKIA